MTRLGVLTAAILFTGIASATDLRAEPEDSLQIAEVALTEASLDRQVTHQVAFPEAAAIIEGARANMGLSDRTTVTLSRFGSHLLPKGADVSERLPNAISIPAIVSPPSFAN